MPYNPTSAIQKAIKRALKTQGISYQELAKRMKMTESGVKKLLNRADLSIARASSIGTVLGLSFEELVEESTADQPAQEVSVPIAVQEYFDADLDAFHIYWLIAAERREVEYVMKSLRVSRQTLFRYLRKLDSFNLIELLPGDRVRVPSIGPVLWQRRGPFMTKLIRRWSNAVVEYTLREMNKNYHFALRHCRLTKASYSDLSKAFNDLNTEFAARSIRESKTHANDDLLDVATVSAVIGESFVTLDRTQLHQ